MVYIIFLKGKRMIAFSVVVKSQKFIQLPLKAKGIILLILTRQKQKA